MAVRELDPVKASDDADGILMFDIYNTRILPNQGEHDIASQWLQPEVVQALAKDSAQLLTKSGTGGVFQDEQHQSAAG